jgi:cellobionic acid phosphorylase
LEWLVKDRTARGLSRIGQGDWNDPLNMAGKGERGESVWLSEALAYALDQWAVIVKRRGDPRREEIFRREAVVLRDAVNRFAWDGQWYARGSTDAGKLFGVRADKEGRIFINSQSWALICGAASGDRIPLTIRSVVKNLLTPCGVMTLAPAFQAMREDIGKLSQKVPGTGENGSAYSHAGVFFAFGLYCVRETELAYRVLRSLLPGAPGNPVSRCGQLPLYIPNYYRGLACGRTAGRSSHGANTGTVAWYYRTVVEMLLGARAELDGLRLDPQLPSAWPGAKLTRRWRGAEFEIAIEREKGIKEPRVFLDGNRLMENLVPIQGAGSRHQVRVLVPK